jgi:hypothetical protein
LLPLQVSVSRKNSEYEAEDETEEVVEAIESGDDESDLSEAFDVKQ